MNRLQNFPFAFSAPILGFAGFVLLLQKISSHLQITPYIWEISFGITALLFVSFLGIYISKIFSFFKIAKQEFLHPVKGNFFAIPAKIFLIFALICFPFSQYLSLIFFIIGSIWQLMITFAMLSLWLHKDIFHPKHLSPAWFLPIVGNLIVPIAGVPLGFIDLSWFFASIGLFFWLALFIIIFNRIIFHDPMPQKFLPTLFILFAPPAIACIAFGKLLGEWNNFSLLLLNFSIFLFFFIIIQVSLFKGIQFFLSWWAYAFPIAALGLASFYAFEQTHKIFYEYFSIGLLVLLTIVLFFLIGKTVGAMRKGEVCVEE